MSFCLITGYSCSVKSVIPPIQEIPPGADVPPSQKPYQINGIWYYPVPTAIAYDEVGTASWYGEKFHGRPTACGEPYDMNQLTAAHKTLPLGTYLKIINIENSKKVVVRINDRGPFVAGRIVDLSYKAAQILDIVNPGTAKVRIEAIIPKEEEQLGEASCVKKNSEHNFRYGNFIIQVGAFQHLTTALQYQKKLLNEFEMVHIQPVVTGGKAYYRVQVGIFKDLIVAQKKREDLKETGFKDAFVVAMDDDEI